MLCVYQNLVLLWGPHGSYCHKNKGYGSYVIKVKSLRHAHSVRVLIIVCVPQACLCTTLCFVPCITGSNEQLPFILCWINLKRTTRQPNFIVRPLFHPTAGNADGLTAERVGPVDQTRGKKSGN